MYTIRQVLPHEYGKYREHLKKLDAESKYLRFGSPIRDDGIDRLCDLIEKERSQHVLFCIEDEELNFVAIGHVALLDGAELAFSVLKPYQGQGIGTALMNRCIQWCRTHGVLKGHIVCLSTNTAMKRLCRKFHMKMDIEYGEVIGSFDLESPDFLAFIQDAINSNLGTLDWINKRTIKFTKFVL